MDVDDSTLHASHVDTCAISIIIKRADAPLTRIDGVDRARLLAASPVLTSMLCGAFAEAGAKVVEISTPWQLASMSASDIIAGAHAFWGSYKLREPGASGADQNGGLGGDDSPPPHMYSTVVWAQMYGVSAIPLALRSMFHDAQVPVTHESFAAARVASLLPLLLHPPCGKPHPNADAEGRVIPAIIAEAANSQEEAFVMLRFWDTHMRGIRLAEEQTPCVRIDGASWPQALGVPIHTDVQVVLTRLCELMAGLFPTPQHLGEYLTAHPCVAIAGGAMLHAVSAHPVRGQLSAGSGDVDFWFCNDAQFRNGKDIAAAATGLHQACHGRDVMQGWVHAVGTWAVQGLTRNIQLVHAAGPDGGRNVIADYDCAATQVMIQSINGTLQLWATIPFLETLVTGVISEWRNGKSRGVRMRKYVDRGYTVTDALAPHVLPEDHEAVARSDLKSYTFGTPAATPRERARMVAAMRQCMPALQSVCYSAATASPELDVHADTRSNLWTQSEGYHQWLNVVMYSFDKYDEVATGASWPEANKGPVVASRLAAATTAPPSGGAVGNGTGVTPATEPAWRVVTATDGINRVLIPRVDLNLGVVHKWMFQFDPASGRPHDDRLHRDKLLVIVGEPAAMEAVTRVSAQLQTDGTPTFLAHAKKNRFSRNDGVMPLFTGPVKPYHDLRVRLRITGKTRIVDAVTGQPRDALGDADAGASLKVRAHVSNGWMLNGSELCPMLVADTILVLPVTATEMWSA